MISITVKTDSGSIASRGKFVLFTINYAVSLSPNPYQNTRNSVKREVIWKLHIVCIMYQVMCKKYRVQGYVHFWT